MAKQYKNLVEFPGIPVGTIFEERGNHYFNAETNSCFAKDIVEAPKKPKKVETTVDTNDFQLI